jgi:Type VI secretion system VasI, EvfG, VC_A0118
MGGEKVSRLFGASGTHRHPISPLESTMTIAYRVAIWNVVLTLVCSLLSGSTEAASDLCTVFPHSEHTTGISRWVIERQASAVGNNLNTALHVTASGTSTHRGDQFTCLVIQCVEGETDVYVEGNGKLMRFSGRSATVTYKIAGRSQSTRRFTSSNDGLAIGLWNSPGAVIFIKDIRGATKLHIEAKPSGSRTIMADFQLGHLDAAIRAAHSTCPW